MRTARVPPALALAPVLLLVFTSRGVGQLPSASADVWGMGGVATAWVRGFGAIGANPAGLGMPRAGHATWALLPVGGVTAMRPVTLFDVGEWNGREIPDLVREGWLERIEDAGRERGAAVAYLTPLAIARGSVGFQLTSTALVDPRLNPDAAEFLLFGNAGRSGEPRDFQFAGSSLDAWLVSTAALAAALPLPLEIGDAPGQSFAVGATLKLTVGHLLFLGRDVGSTFSGEPVELGLRFPVLQTDTAYRDLESGLGVGLDLGFQWEGDAWGAGLVLTNLVQTFSWDIDDLHFRPGTALFTTDVSESGFGARPGREAPPPLLDARRDFSFGRRLAAGVAHRPGERVLVTAELSARFGGGGALAPPLELGGAVEFRATPFLPLRANLGLVTGGVRLGAGTGWTSGRFNLVGGLGYLTGQDAILGTVAFSLGGS